MARISTPRHRYSAYFSRGFGLAACVLTALSAYDFRWEPGSILLPLATVFMILGAVSLLSALYLRRLTRQPQPRFVFSSPPQALRTGEAALAPTSVHANYRLALPGIIALLLLIEINARFTQIPPLQSVSLGVQLSLLIVGLVLTPLGLGGWRPSSKGLPFPALVRPSVTGCSLILITLLALGIRLWHLDSAVHKWVDEIHFAVAVMSLRLPLEPAQLLAPFGTITAFPWLYPFMQSWFVGLGGRNLESLRLLSVIVGTLGIPALYFLAKTLFDRPTALIAALFLATFPPHIQFSRIALNNIADPLAGTLALAFLIRGLKSGSRLDFAWAGTMLGLTQYFYEGGRFLFPILMLLWLAWFLLINRFSRSPHGRLSLSHTSLSTFFITALLIGLPIYTTLLRSATPLDLRFQTVGIGGSYWFRVLSYGTLQTLEEQILHPLLIIVHLPERGLYYGGEQGLLLPYMVALFFLGLVWSLWHWRSPGSVLPVWVLLTSAGNMLLTDSAISARYVVAFPALMLVAAVGLRYIGSLMFAPSASNLEYPLAGFSGCIVFALAIVLSVAQVQYYFGPHLETYNRQLRPYYDSEDAIFRAAQLPPVTNALIISDNTPTEAYLSGLAGYLTDSLIVKVLPLMAVSQTYFDNLQRDLNYAFFVEPTDTVTVELLRRSFKVQGPFHSPFDLDPIKQLLLYYAPARSN